MQNNKIAGRAKSVRSSSVRAVEDHLSKQRQAYDSWIQELCRDAEESAAERDRLKAKLKTLRAEQKRKMMIKIMSRMANMVFYRAWSHWYNAAIRINQMSIEMQIGILRKQVAESRDKAAALEAEAQARADQAAEQAFGAASSEQRSLILKIMTKMVTGFARVYYAHWVKQTFMHKHQKQLVGKILKKLCNSQLNCGWTRWKTIATKWALLEKTDLKNALVAQLALLERQAKEFEADAQQRSDDATAAAIARCSSEQKCLLVKILAKMCGNFTLYGWARWRLRLAEHDRVLKLITKILARLVGGKMNQAFKLWYLVCFATGSDKFKVKEDLLRTQRDALAQQLRDRAVTLGALQQEVAGLLQLSRSNAHNTAQVMAASNQFADNLLTLIDKRALEPEKPPAPSYAEFVGALDN